MRLKEWVRRQGTGAISRLQRETGLAYSTIFRAAHDRKPVRFATAKLLSEATNGAVSVEELCECPAMPLAHTSRA